ncbi:sensor histidine kinase [Xanthomonas arboricola pv. juglandis]|uniref:sensor histidine kinase n=1 Tax=Xanthomonas arboricola TaxID=56448 RepID=UPI0002F06260|nr:histidine kinase [Xanthomonas arboricola]MDN0222045.1 histidine kinase [Xanthomonas arboricola pv. juglandis]MDN0226203.1 histidine kinase [Xanthomonas arboricola pv. juglandis]MDN0230540.1 histidine kinase [Xanthomonas arboricola pv. juglandis]MDN0234756.1 histidine kinase [Xanthomonas arboricola pv. juglandis]MDN0239032.1 histidine kinase [Xanthomonas arboricola pv. juglandis]
MSASVFLIVRIVFAWAAALVVAGIMWAQLFGSIGPIFALASLALMTLALMSAITHVRRVRLIAGRLDHDTLSTRQRRQIEVPLDVQASFAVMEEAVRALPRVQDIECAPGSLLIRAKVRRIGRHDGRQPSRNQVLVTIAPGQGTSSVTVLCEPDAGAWVDLFAVDEGSNYENAEAINRAVVRRVGEQRRDEQAAAEQSVMEKELAVARLNLLHAQVEPHFLYNTLASAQVLARTDPPRAEIMIGHLIQYLRSSLPSADGAIATLGEELERTQAYLEILRIRMGTRLALQVEVPYELRTLQLPSMMLQTLVENAIKHGLEPKPGGGTVWILARRNDDHATLTVADDGQGFNLHSQGTGIGLKNLRERLQLIYAGKASFAIVSNFPSGVAATITLPLPAQPAGPRPPPLPAAATAAQVQA